MGILGLGRKKKADDEIAAEPEVVEETPTGPALLLLIPEVAGGTSFRLLRFYDVAAACEYLKTMHPVAVSRVHAFWALLEKPVESAQGGEAMVLIRSESGSDLVYVVSFVDIESALSFAKFEVKRGMNLAQLMVYWAELATIDTKPDGFIITPDVPPAPGARPSLATPQVEGAPVAGAVPRIVDARTESTAAETTVESSLLEVASAEPEAQGGVTTKWVKRTPEAEEPDGIAEPQVTLEPEVEYVTPAEDLVEATPAAPPRESAAPEEAPSVGAGSVAWATEPDDTSAAQADSIAEAAQDTQAASDDASILQQSMASEELTAELTVDQHTHSEEAITPYSEASEPEPAETEQGLTELIAEFAPEESGDESPRADPAAEQWSLSVEDDESEESFEQVEDVATAEAETSQSIAWVEPEPEPELREEAAEPVSAEHVETVEAEILKQPEETNAPVEVLATEDATPITAGDEVYEAAPAEPISEDQASVPEANEAFDASPEAADLVGEAEVVSSADPQEEPVAETLPDAEVVEAADLDTVDEESAAPELVEAIAEDDQQTVDDAEASLQAEAVPEEDLPLEVETTAAETEEPTLEDAEPPLQAEAVPEEDLPLEVDATEVETEEPTLEDAEPPLQAEAVPEEDLPLEVEATAIETEEPTLEDAEPPLQAEAVPEEGLPLEVEATAIETEEAALEVAETSPLAEAVPEEDLPLEVEAAVSEAEEPSFDDADPMPVLPPSFLREDGADPPVDDYELEDEPITPQTLQAVDEAEEGAWAQPFTEAEDASNDEWAEAPVYSEESTEINPDRQNGDTEDATSFPYEEPVPAGAHAAVNGSHLAGGDEDEPPENIPGEEQLSPEMAAFLRSRRRVSKDNPFKGFDSPPGRF